MLLAFLNVTIFTARAQNADCKVLLNSIKGTYEGGCSNGKAEGKGKAAGIDIYEGDFKNGLPDGKGMYIWKDGHYFIGFYKKGNKDGSGDMYYESANGNDSVITGFWKKDKYFGEYENHCVVISNTSGITKVGCNLTDTNETNITINVHQLRSSFIPIIGDISIVSGTFNSRNTQTLTNSSMTTIRQVTFPFKAIFYMSNGEQTQIVFNTKGNYNVSIELE